MPELCRGCCRRIESGKYWRTTQGHTYHDNCFKCSDCYKFFNTYDPAYFEMGKYFCKKDFMKRWGISCKGCSRYIESGDTVWRVSGNAYHANCMKCIRCDKVIGRDEKLYAPSNIQTGKFLCEGCIRNEPDSGDTEAETLTTTEDPLVPSVDIKSKDEERPFGGWDDTLETNVKQPKGSKKSKLTKVMGTVFATSFDILL